MMDLSLLLIYSVCLMACVSAKATSENEINNGLDPDFDRTIPQLIESRNFIAETHIVTTADGYILTIFRIVNPLVKTAGRPVILQHGLMSSGQDFIINSPGGDAGEDLNGTTGNNIGFELSKRAYDVWLPNSRGNRYSRNHTFFNPNTRKDFWDFSFDQMIKHDLPSTINYVLSVTKRKTIGYVGHSQGTLILFGLMSESPQYNEIVKPFIALAPVTSVGNSATPFKHLARIPFIDQMMERIGGEFLPSNQITNKIAETLCRSRLQSICSNIMFLANGFNDAQLNHSRIAVYYSHFPGGTSVRNMVHYAQSVRSGKFAKYDYGSKKNMKMYGSKTAPEYEIEKITSRDIILFSSENDWLASPADVRLLMQRLKLHSIQNHKIPVKEWNHLDFLIGKDAGRLVNQEVLNILHSYNEWK